MATQPTLAGTTLPHPYRFEPDREYRGGQRIMADGTTVTDLVNSNAKHTFLLEWRALSVSDLSTIETAFGAIKDASGTFLSPRNVSYTVSHDPNNRKLSCRAVLSANGVLRWDVTMHLREE